LRTNFTPQARQDLRDIRDWIAQDDERAAERVISRIRQTVMMFEAFPLLGHAGAVAGTREFKVTGLPYLVVYQLANEAEIDILAIIHAKRDYPKEETGTKR
jgi:toxin ParE1/3/4